MAIRYKLVQKRNPQDPEGPRKWYATTNAQGALPETEMMKRATKNSTVSPGEFRLSMEALVSYVPEELRNGRNVRIPGLGTFRMTFKSQGADTVEGYDANEMIYEPRVTFLPEASFREALINGLEFEDGGVLEDGVSYASRADYKKAKEGGEPQA